MIGFIDDPQSRLVSTAWLVPNETLLTSILISGVTILNLPIDLLHVEEITHGRVHQRQMEYLPWIRGSRYLNDFKLQVNF